MLGAAQAKKNLNLSKPVSKSLQTFFTARAEHVYKNKPDRVIERLILYHLAKFRCLIPKTDRHMANENLQKSPKIVRFQKVKLGLK